MAKLKWTLLLPVCLAACAVPGEPEIPVPEACEIEGVTNCRRIGDDLLFAGQLSPAAIEELGRRGFRTIVTTRGIGELEWDERERVAAQGMAFAEIPMAYPIEEIRDEWVDRLDSLFEGAERPMVVHCSSGNRVAGLWAVWLAERRGVEAARALELGARAGMTRIRPVVEKRLAAR